MVDAERREDARRAIEAFLDFNNQARNTKTKEEFEALRKSCVEQAKIIREKGHRLPEFVQQQLFNRFGINPETLEPIRD